MEDQVVNTTKKLSFSELENIWPTVEKVRARLLSGTYSTVSLFKY